MKIVHVTSVHPRHDIRINFKMCTTIAAVRLGPVALIVADGRGDHLELGFKIHDIGSLGSGRFARALLGNVNMLCCVVRYRAEVIHFHDPELIPMGLVLRLLGRRVIYDVHEDLPRQLMFKKWIPAWARWAAARVAEAIEWIAVRMFTAVVAATPKIAARFPARRTWLIQNYPIIDEFVLPAATPYKLRPRAFTYIGGLSEIRGANEMVQAIHILSREVMATLEIGGTFSSTDIERALKSTPGWARVRHHGWLGRAGIATLLDESRAGLVVLHPVQNYIDSQPIKLFEYMAAGIPVIASDFPLWRSIIDEAKCGLLVDPRDPVAIADAMQWVLEHPDEADEMGQRGREAVENRFNWEHESQTLVSLYREILK